MAWFLHAVDQPSQGARCIIRGFFMTRLTLLAATAIATAFSAPASALLTGNSVGIQYIFPDITTVYQDLGSNLVGTDGPTAFPGYFDFSFTDATATTSAFQFASSWTTTSFNGFRLYDFNNTIAAFTSVTINPASNMTGLDASRITFDANNIYVNWNGLNFDSGTIVTLDINGGSAVPEPASWAMMIGGFGLVGAAMRRRKVALAA